MSFDVAVVGAPFLDLTFEGLPSMPRPGDELLARSLHVAPGGTGMQAIAAARLGLKTALVAPIAANDAGALIRGILEREGVTILPDAAREGGVPTTALLSTPDGTAMATVADGTEPTVEDVAAADAAVVLASLGRIHLAPMGATVVAVTGTLEIDSVLKDRDEILPRAQTIILNASEATKLTGTDDAGEAARMLASGGRTAIVTLGPDGAIGAREGTVEIVDAPDVTVADATGAGDVFAAAFVWAEMQTSSLRDVLAHACLYASLSVRAPTAFEGAPSREDFTAEARSRGLV